MCRYDNEPEEDPRLISLNLGEQEDNRIMWTLEENNKMKMWKTILKLSQEHRQTRKDMALRKILKIEDETLKKSTALAYNQANDDRAEVYRKEARSEDFMDLWEFSTDTIKEYNDKLDIAERFVEAERTCSESFYEIIMSKPVDQELFVEVTDARNAIILKGNALKFNM